MMNLVHHQGLNNLVHFHGALWVNLFIKGHQDNYSMPGNLLSCNIQVIYLFIKLFVLYEATHFIKILVLYVATCITFINLGMLKVE